MCCAALSHQLLKSVELMLYDPVVVIVRMPRSFAEVKDQAR